MVVVSQCVRTAVGLRYVTTVSCYNFAIYCVLKRGSLSIPIKIFSEEHKLTRHFLLTNCFILFYRFTFYDGRDTSIFTNGNAF